MRMRLQLVTLSLSTLAVFVGCNPAEAICQKEYDCQDELKLDLEDDYVDICARAHEGANAALRESAEQECEDLANAEVALASCQAALSCEDLAKFRKGEDGTACDEPKKSYEDAVKDADGGATCDGVVNPEDGDPPPG